MTEREKTMDATPAPAAPAPGAARKAGGAPRLLTWAAFALAAAIAFSLAFAPLRTSHDEFWHLKTGQWITQHGALPKNEIFTYTAANMPWHNHEWLTQVLMWKLYTWGEAGKEALWGGTSDLGGWGAVILAKALLIVLAYIGLGLALGRRMRQPVWAALAAAVGAALARRTFYPRPPVVTYFLLGLTLWVLIEWREGRLRGRWLWLLAPLFALWSNLHGGWLAGLIVMGGFWADAAAGTLFPNAKGKMQNAKCEFRAPRSVLLLTGVGLACALATLANPFGYHLWELPFTVMKDKYLARCIGELLPPNWYFVWAIEGLMLALAVAAIRPVRAWGFVGAAAAAGGVALGIAGLNHLFHYHIGREGDPCPTPAAAWAQTALALAIFGAAIIRLRRAGWLAHLLIVAFFAQQGIHHVRHLTLLAVVIIPTLAWSLEAWAVAWAEAGGRPAGRARGREIAAAAAGGCALLVLGGWWIFGWGWGVVAPREPAAIRYNQLLASGMELQTAVVVNDDKTTWWAPSTLPQGRFLIDGYPVKAVDFLERTRLPGPLWNGGNYAGYLIWRLAPEKYKVYTDNRYDIYGGLALRQEHSVRDGFSQADLDKVLKQNPGLFKGPTPPPWDAVLDQAGAQTVFIPAEARGNMRLAQGGWARVWEDYDFNIWVRDTPQNKEAIARARALPRPQTARPLP